MTGVISIDFLYFIFYSFIGWICEVLFCSLLFKKWVNRGFLFGPVCPIYGVGAVLVISLLQPFTFNIWLTFLLGILVASLLEYGTGYAMEKMFHTKWWDYSHHRFHIRGRVCLTNSLLFGVMTVAVLFVIHPALSARIEGLPLGLTRLLSVLFAITLTADTILSVWSILRLNQTMAYLKEISAQTYKRLEESQHHMEEIWADYIERVRENLNLPAETAKLREKLKTYIRKQSPFEQFSARRLMDAFPKMRPLKLNGQLHHFIQSIEEIRIERHNKKTEK